MTALVAFLLWRADRSAKEKDAALRSKSLAKLMFPDITAILAKAHSLAKKLPNSQNELDLMAAYFSKNPNILFENLEPAATINSSRFERLSEILGVLPAATTSKLAQLHVSIVGLQEMRLTLKDSKSMEEEDIKVILRMIQELYADSTAAYLSLAEASGLTPEKLAKAAAGIASVP